MKILFDRMYALLYYICCIFPVNNKKVVCGVLHDADPDGNIGRLVKTIKKNDSSLRLYYVTKKNILAYIFVSPYHLATAGYIFLDNTTMAMGYMVKRPNAKVIQLWHGVTAMKKMEQCFYTGSIKRRNAKIGRFYSDVIVSAKSLMSIHAQSFNVPLSKVKPLGLPRTDLFFDKSEVEREKQAFLTQFPEYDGKKIILYAPTFRDDSPERYDNEMDLSEIEKHLPENYVLLTRFHPLVATKARESFSGYVRLNRLLCAADILITDYSSIMFEFALLNRPIIFYAYDLPKYEKSVRGFNYPYANFVPGTIVQSKQALIDCLLQTIDNQGYADHDAFNQQFYDYYDGKASQRIFEYVFG